MFWYLCVAMLALACVLVPFAYHTAVPKPLKVWAAQDMALDLILLFLILSLILMGGMHYGFWSRSVVLYL